MALPYGPKLRRLSLVVNSWSKKGFAFCSMRFVLSVFPFERIPLNWRKVLHTLHLQSPKHISNSKSISVKTAIVTTIHSTWTKYSRTYLRHTHSTLGKTSASNNSKWNLLPTAISSAPSCKSFQSRLGRSLYNHQPVPTTPWIWRPGIQF